MFLSVLLFAIAMAGVLEAAIKTVERLKKIILHIVGKSFTQNDFNKLLLIAGGIFISVYCGVTVLDTIAAPVLGVDFSFGVVGMVLFGLFLGRGSNVLHNFYEKFKDWSGTGTPRTEE